MAPGRAGDGSPRRTRHSQHPSPERLGWALTPVPRFPSGPSGWWRGALLPPATVSSVGDAGAEAAEATKWGGPGAPPGLYQGLWASSSCPTVAWAGARPLRTVAFDQRGAGEAGGDGCRPPSVGGSVCRQWWKIRGVGHNRLHRDPSGSGPWERVRRTLGAQPRPTESEMPICYPSPARCCGQCLRGPDEAGRRGPDPRRSARWGPATQRGRQPESCPRKPSPGPPRGTFGGAAWHSNGTLGVKLRIWRWPQCWVTQGPSQREARTEDARALAVRRNQDL